LIGLNECCVQAAQTLKTVATAAGDDESVDLGVERTQVHQKALWMLRSLLK
jgi:DNA-binding ferritin-like protein